MAQIRQRLQKVVVAIHVLSIVFLVIAVALFGDGYRRYNNEQNSTSGDRVCFLDNKLSGSTSKPGDDYYCILSIFTEVLAALGLIPLVILSIVKLVHKFVR